MATTACFDSYEGCHEATTQRCGLDLTECQISGNLASVKTTLEIDDALYREVKALAAMRGRKIKDLVNEGLEHVLRKEGDTRQAASAGKMKLPLVPSDPTKGRVASERIYELESSADSAPW